MNFKPTFSPFYEKKFLFLLAGLMLAHVVLFSQGAKQQKVLHFGVFAYLGIDETRAKYQPIADYLNQVLYQDSVVLEVLSQEEIYRRVGEQSLDFITTNPSHFLTIRHSYPLTGVLATLVNCDKGKPVRQLGGAILVLNNRKDISTLKDLRNKVIAAPGSNNLGAYRTQLYELHLNGLSESDFTLLPTGEMKSALRAVLEKRADACFLRDGILEQMIAQGELKEGDIRLLNEQNHTHFPHRVSTALYPEWPVFALPHVSERTALNFASALFSIEPKSSVAQAAGISGYTIPADYNGMEQMLKALRLPPYDQAPDFTLGDIWQLYWGWILALFVSLMLIAYFLVLSWILAWTARKSKQKAESVLRSVGEGIYGIGSNGVCTFCNEEALRILGVTEDKLVGQDQHEIFHHHYANGHVYPNQDCPIFKTSQDGQPRRCEEWFFKADGTGFPVELSVEPLWDRSRLVGAIVAFRDITERKQAEKALKEHNQFVNTLLGAIPVAVFFKDTEGHYIGCNRIFSEITGLSEDQIKGKTVFELWPNEFSQTYHQKDLEMLKNPQHQIYDYKLTDREGNIRPVIFAKDVYLDAEGNPAGIVGAFLDISERIKMEDALAKSEKKYHKLSNLLRLLADNMPDMLWAKNLDKEYLFANKSICDNLLNAIDTEEPLGKTDMYFASRERNSHPENPEWHTFGEICRDSDAITLQEMKPMKFDEYGNVKGKFLFLDVHKAPLYNEDGKLIGVVGSARDVTAAKEAEMLVRKLSRAVEQSPAAVVITDTNGNIEYVNPKFTQLTGYTFEEAIGKNPNVLRAGNQPPEYFDYLWETISSGKEWQGEFHNKKKNGDLYWETATISPIKNENGEPTHYLAIKEDITKRKELENTLKEQAAFRELLMEISSGFINIPLHKVDEMVKTSLEKMAVFVKADRSYIFDYDWNSEVCSNTYEWCGQGTSPEIENLQNLPIRMMGETPDCHRKGQPVYTPDVKAMPEGPGKEIIESQGIKSFLTVPLMNDNYCIGFVGFDYVGDFHTFTEPEVQLLEIFAQMLVNVRLRQEMDAQLILSKEKAEESDSLKMAFLQNMSHEIRTPMNAIQGFSALLGRPGLSDEKRQNYTSIIQNSSIQLLTIVNDILTISSIDTGQEKINQSNVCINKLVLETEAIFSQQAKDKPLTIKALTTLPENEAKILADITKLTQILANLISNAVKYTPVGEIVFGYTLKETFLEFFVKDNGIGIEKSKHDLIFERFAQANDSIRYEYGGTGLGLSICKGYVELMGGKIWVESEPGKGATFFFTIPYIPTTKDADIILKDHIHKSQPENITILIVEDDPLSYRLLTEFLKGNNYTIILANNGQEAVDICRENESVSLVLMDIKMPVMDGIQATKLIKEFRPKLPIIAQSAYATEQEIVRKNNLFAAYITKPIHAQILLFTIGQYVNDGK
jgi:PAS domain S-box-containing protein